MRTPLQSYFLASLSHFFLEQATNLPNQKGGKDFTACESVSYDVFWETPHQRLFTPQVVIEYPPYTVYSDGGGGGGGGSRERKNRRRRRRGRGWGKRSKLHCMLTVVKVLMKRNRNMGPLPQRTCWQGNHDQLFVIVNFPWKSLLYCRVQKAARK